jgi:DNA-binding beta-propeller fold protein YncE
MRQATLAGLATAAILATGCSGTPAAGQGSSPGPTVPGTAPAVSPVGLTAHSMPGCTAATQRARALSRAAISLSRVPAPPFGVATAPNGTWAFVSLISAVGVFRTSGSPIPVLVRQVATAAGGAIGNSLSPDGRYLLVADGQAGADVFSARALETGSPGALLGVLSGPGGGRGGAIEAAVSPDGSFAFVSAEGGGVINVFNLHRALTAGFAPADYVGSIPAQIAPVGLAFSPDRRWLYFTSEAAHLPAVSGPGAPAPVGSLTVVSVAKAETDPARSVVAVVPAGCEPVRVVTSADGRIVWVTARASDALLAFDATRLRTDPRHALLAAVRVGEAPVGLALVRGGARIVVADSNRFSAGSAVASLAVVDVPAALAGNAALLGYLPAGRFPREMALEPGGKVLLVTNFGSRQLEAVDVARLP